MLVIDDDEDIRELFTAVLTAEGYVLATAADGREGLALAETFQPSVIILDLMMPVMDGAEFRRRQIQSTQLASIPVVCISAWAEAQSIAARLGIEGLRKPVDWDQLVRLVDAKCAGC